MADGEDGESNLSQVDISIILFVASGILAFLLLFIFAKRQITRYTLRSKKGPHMPIGQDATKVFRADIDRQLQRTKDILYEPPLVSPGIGMENKDIWRMKTIDDHKLLEMELLAVPKIKKRKAMDPVRQYLYSFSNILFPTCHGALEKYLSNYERARYGVGEISQTDYFESVDSLRELLNSIKQWRKQHSTQDIPAITVSTPTCASERYHHSSPQTHLTSHGMNDHPVTNTCTSKVIYRQNLPKNRVENNDRFDV